MCILFVKDWSHFHPNSPPQSKLWYQLIRIRSDNGNLYWTNEQPQVFESLKLSQLTNLTNCPLPISTHILFIGRVPNLFLLTSQVSWLTNLLSISNVVQISPSQFEVHAGWASRRKPWVFFLVFYALDFFELFIEKLVKLFIGCTYGFSWYELILSSYAYIYTSNGVSLHELAIFLSKDRKCTAKYSDDACIVCWDGGNLLLCNGCPRAFHKGQI